MSYTCKRPSDYVMFKVDVLDQLGLHNKDGIERRLRSVPKSRIDAVARQLLMDFYDGDKTYAFSGGC